MDPFNKLVAQSSFPLRTGFLYDNPNVWMDRTGPSVVQPFGNFARLKLYFPIDRSGLFEPSSVTFAPGGPITPLQLLQSIREVYQTPLTIETLDEYAERNPDYQVLRDRYYQEQDIKLEDALGNLDRITGLSEYQDGYLVNLSS